MNTETQTENTTTKRKKETEKMESVQKNANKI